VAPGVYVQVGQSVATLVRTDPLRFRGGVPEREAIHVRPGHEVALAVTGGRTIERQRVARVSPALDAASHSLTIEVDVENADGSLKSGLFAEAAIVIDPQATALAVPSSAVYDFAGVEKVLLVQDGQAKEQRVQTGRRSSELVEITSGLKSGDVVAVDASRVQPGKVTVVSGDEAAALSE
jgi:RND family efflux transporter MFP subunit